EDVKGREQIDVIGVGVALLGGRTHDHGFTTPVVLGTCPSGLRSFRRGVFTVVHSALLFGPHPCSSFTCRRRCRGVHGRCSSAAHGPPRRWSPGPNGSLCNGSGPARRTDSPRR